MLTTRAKKPISDNNFADGYYKSARQPQAYKSHWTFLQHRLLDEIDTDPCLMESGSESSASMMEIRIRNTEPKRFG